MIPAAFDYVRADSADQALARLAEHGEDAKLLAGGQSLLPMLKLRLAQVPLLVDVSRITDLSYVRPDGDQVAIGALTRHHDLVTSTLLAQEVPLLPYVASLVGDPQIRHRGTLGGSLAHADPAADLPAAVLALDATLVIRGPRGERRVGVSDFFQGYYETAIGPDEMLVEVRVPRLAGAGWAYQKLVRRSNDWAIVAVAAIVGEQAGTGRVALAHMGATPLRARATERALAAGAAPVEAAAVADEDTAPTQDMHAEPDYRRHLARVLTERALVQALR